MSDIKLVPKSMIQAKLDEMCDGQKARLAEILEFTKRKPVAVIIPKTWSPVVVEQRKHYNKSCFNWS